MRRREFVQSAAVVLAATALPVNLAQKDWREMTVEEFARDCARKRSAGIQPNFDCQHWCPRCGVSYLCPDRYVMPDCGPTRAMRQSASVGAVSMSCSPCSMNVEKYGPPGFRQLWLEAHKA